MKENACDKVVLVTEAGKAVGRAVALAFAREGCSLALCDEQEERLAETMRAVRDAGAHAHAIALKAGMASPEDLDRAVARAVESLGEVDILVNTVGNVEDLVAENRGELTEEDWLALFSLNVMSALRAINLVIPAMLRKKSGRIINIFADIREGDARLMSLAVACKASLLSLTRRLARQYKEENIVISMVSPAALGLTLVETMLLTESKKFDEILESQMRRFMTDLRQFVELGLRMSPEEVAKAVMLLSAVKPSSLGGTSIRIEQGDIVASMP